MTLMWIWMLFPDFLAKYWFPYLPVLLIIEIYLDSARVPTCSSRGISGVAKNPHVLSRYLTSRSEDDAA
jgi:hypothetical protein